jgi:hypothetical protein
MFVFTETSKATGTVLTGGGGGGTGGAAGVELEPPPPQAAITSEKIDNHNGPSERILVSPIRPVERSGRVCSPTRVIKSEAETSATFVVASVLV